MGGFLGIEICCVRKFRLSLEESLWVVLVDGFVCCFAHGFVRCCVLFCALFCALFCMVFVYGLCRVGGVFGCVKGVYGRDGKTDWVYGL